MGGPCRAILDHYGVMPVFHGVFPPCGFFVGRSVRALFAGALLCFFAYRAFPVETVTIVTSDFPPYVRDASDGYGPLCEIVAAAFALEGVLVRFEFYPWSRCESEIRSGRAFAAMPYRPTEVRAREFDFSEPLYRYNAYFFYSKTSHPEGIPYERLEDLRPYVIGAVQGFWYVPRFLEAGLTLDLVVSVDQNFRKLLAGRIDAFPEEENVGWYTVRKLFPEMEGAIGTLAKPLDEPDNPNAL